MEKNSDPWSMVVGLMLSYRKKPSKADALLSKLPDSINAQDRRRCQFLFLGLIRHLRLVDAALSAFLRKPPRDDLFVRLEVAAFELIQADSPERLPKIVHHAVERIKNELSAREAGLANAVLRKIPAQIQALQDDAAKPDASAQALSIAYSHPQWLVERWLENFDKETTCRLLRWNQEPSPTYLRARTNAAVPDSLAPTQWDHFYEYKGSDWASVEARIQTGQLYAQDPSTRLPPELLGCQPGEKVLDACAAPGGKTIQLAEALQGGQLIAVDQRMAQLCANLAGMNVEIREADLLAEVIGLPSDFDAILLDAPCSNTGVLRRRPDAKWRLDPKEIARSAQVQRQLLEKVGALLRPGGRLVYSTCSIEPEENRRLIEDFLNENPAFHLQRAHVSYP